MSFKVTGIVLDHFPGGGGPLLLALVLADRAGHDGSGIFYSVDTMAVLTRQTRRGVQKQLREMESTGWLVAVERSNGGAGNTTTYRIPIDLIPQHLLGKANVVRRLIPAPTKVEQAVADLTSVLRETANGEAPEQRKEKHLNRERHDKKPRTARQITANYVRPIHTYPYYP